MGDEFVTAAELQKRYRISSVTLWRWIKNARLGFPAPMAFSRQRLWRRSDIATWEAQNSGAHAA